MFGIDGGKCKTESFSNLRTYAANEASQTPKKYNYKKFIKDT